MRRRVLARLHFYKQNLIAAVCVCLCVASPFLASELFCILHVTLEAAGSFILLTQALFCHATLFALLCRFKRDGT